MNAKIKNKPSFAVLTSSCLYTSQLIIQIVGWELRVRKCMTYPVKITSQHPLGENLKENQAIWKMNVLYTKKKKVSLISRG